jgi:DNA-binding MarR family transcriptional regulator
MRQGCFNACVQNSEAMALSAALLAVAGGLTQRINEGVLARGFEGVRPAHGFAFARLAPDGATVTDLAAHLGVTKQAASQLVDELVRKGYAERRPHPEDARARLVVLTERGWGCTRAAEEAAAEAVREWGNLLGEREVRSLGRQLLRIAPDGPIRPAW